MSEINPYESPQSDLRSAPPAIEPEVSVPPPLAIEVIEPETKEEVLQRLTKGVLIGQLFLVGGIFYSLLTGTNSGDFAGWLAFRATINANALASFLVAVFQFKKRGWVFALEIVSLIVSVSFLVMSRS